MELVVKCLLVSICVILSESREEANPKHVRIPLQLSPLTPYSGIHPRYPNDFYDDHFNNWYLWLMNKPHKNQDFAENHFEPSEGPHNDQNNDFSWNNFKPERGSNQHFRWLHRPIANFNFRPSTQAPKLFDDNLNIDDTESHLANVNSEVTESSLSYDDKITNYDNNDADLSVNNVNEETKYDREDKSHEDIGMAKEIGKDESKDGAKADKNSNLSKNTDYILVSSQQNPGQAAVPLTSMVVPAISIQPLQNQAVSSGSNINVQGLAVPNQVILNNQPSNVDSSIPKAIPLNVPINQLSNTQPTNSYTVASTSNVISNAPNSYYLVNNGQAIPINNVNQNPTQMYALVPINNLGNVITNQPNNFVTFGNQQNQNYVLTNQPGNVIAYSNPQNVASQPNNQIPISNQPNYVTLNTQTGNLVPLNNQGNQYVAFTNQPNNIAMLSNSNNLVTVNNPSNLVTFGNQPNNVVALNNQNVVTLDNQANNLVTLNNQPNLVAVNSGGNVPIYVTSQPQPNVVQLFALKDQDKVDSGTSGETPEGTLDEKNAGDSVHEEIRSTEKVVREETILNIDA